MHILNNLSLTKTNDLLNELYGYVPGDNHKSLPYIDYILEDKSNYPPASSAINYVNDKPFIDVDNDFLIGGSGGVLFKWDFIFVNTHLFSEAAKHYDEFGTYCNAPTGSMEYNKFWARETNRRKRGLSRKCRLYVKDLLEYHNPNTTEDRKKELLHPIRITGEHYTYLNYSRIERTPNDEERAKLLAEGMTRVKTIEAFPRFWDGDYWAFKSDEFAVNNESNNITAKARRKGYSYKKGSKSANTMNLIPKVTIINVADSLDYLTDSGALTYMTKVNLDWLENKTCWKRGYLKETLDNLELGYKKKSESNKPFGFRSKLLSYAIARNTSVAIGKKAIEINIEEAGKCPNMKQFIEVTLSNMESGAIQIGTFNIWGTGGTKGSNWEDFEKIFRNPRDINALEFENIWDFDKRHEVCGFFHPQVLNLEPYIVDGNTLHFEAFKYDANDKLKAKTNKSNDDFIVYCAQRANTPAEAFINTLENIFASPELNTFITEVKLDSKYKGYTDGWYVSTDKGVEFYSKEKCMVEKVFGHNKFHDFIVDVPHRNTTDTHGCVREYMPIFKDNTGRIPKDLYFVVVDPYGVDKQNNLVTDKHSLYSIQVYMRENTVTPYRGKRLVAEYVGRLNSMKDNDKLLVLFCKRWEAKALVEINRGETISNFKTWKYHNLLLFDPRVYTDASVNTVDKRSDYGIHISPETKYLGLTLLKDYLYEIIAQDADGMYYRFYDIPSLQLLQELQKFSSTGNFDRISTALIAMFEFKKDEHKRKASLFGTPKGDNSKRLYNKLTRN